MVTESKDFYEQMRSCRAAYDRLAMSINDAVHPVEAESISAIDIGCGVGCQTAWLAKHGWSIVGVDTGQFKPEPGFGFVRGDVTSRDWACTEYDVVICTETAEHVLSDRADGLVTACTDSARKFIVWSAAQPGQEWEGHVNLQPTSYWLFKFQTQGWVVDDTRTEALRRRMLAVKAQHYLAKDNFFVLVPKEKPTQLTDFASARNFFVPSLVVVDDIYPQPHNVRALAMQQTFAKQGSAGLRSEGDFRHLIDKQIFERLLGRKIVDWERDPINGKFQICWAGDPIVHHSDDQQYAATIFLTPNAPPESGLSLIRNRKGEGPAEHNFYDSTAWETIDRVANVFNRLVIWRADRPHAPSCYFGDSLATGRLFQVFFFNLED